MESEAARDRTGLPLACEMSALTYEQRQRELYRWLRADVKEVRKLQDGYAFRHSADGDMLLAISEFVSN